MYIVRFYIIYAVCPYSLYIIYAVCPYSLYIIYAACPYSMLYIIYIGLAREPLIQNSLFLWILIVNVEESRADTRAILVDAQSATVLSAMCLPVKDRNGAGCQSGSHPPSSL